MKITKAFYIIIWFSSMSYSMHGQNNMQNCHTEYIIEHDLEFIYSEVDSLLIAITGEESLQNAFVLFYTDPDYYYEKTSFDSDIHNLIIENQFEVFFSIWKLDWTINLSNKRNIWLSINKERGEYWKYLYENFEKLSPFFKRIYKATIEEDPEYAFTIAQNNVKELVYENEFDKSLLTVLLITWTINST